MTLDTCGKWRQHNASLLRVVRLLSTGLLPFYCGAEGKVEDRRKKLTKKIKTWSTFFLCPQKWSVTEKRKLHRQGSICKGKGFLRLMLDWNLSYQMTFYLHKTITFPKAFSALMIASQRALHSNCQDLKYIAWARLGLLQVFLATRFEYWTTHKIHIVQLSPPIH